MHRFLKAAGFTDLKTDREAVRFLRQTVMQPENQCLQFTLEDGSVFREYRVALNEYVGICAGVVCIEDMEPICEYYYPYLENAENVSEAHCVIERHTLQSTYSGVLEDYTPGVSLIFFLNNPAEYRKHVTEGTAENEYASASLGAFSMDAKVLLPVMQHQELTDEGSAGNDASELLEAAKNGDEDAIYTLTANDMALYEQINARLESEDLYSVVEQSFMPCGVECDLYSVIAVIDRIEETENRFTGEEMWIMSLSCNGVNFRLCIDKCDLLGEPLVGRRIKCGLWLQGRVNFG